MTIKVLYTTTDFAEKSGTLSSVLKKFFSKTQIKKSSIPTFKLRFNLGLGIKPSRIKSLIGLRFPHFHLIIRLGKGNIDQR